MASPSWPRGYSNGHSHDALHRRSRQWQSSLHRTHASQNTRSTACGWRIFFAGEPGSYRCSLLRHAACHPHLGSLHSTIIDFSVPFLSGMPLTHATYLDVLATDAIRFYAFMKGSSESCETCGSPRTCRELYHTTKKSHIRENFSRGGEASSRRIHKSNNESIQDDICLHKIFTRTQ